MKRQKSGVYRSKMLIGRDLAGKPVCKWFQGRTRVELEEARQRVRARYVTGEPSEPDQLFEVYAKAWFEVRKAPHLAPGTREVYLAALHRRLDQLDTAGRLLFGKSCGKVASPKLDIPQR